MKWDSVENDLMSSEIEGDSEVDLQDVEREEEEDEDEEEESKEEEKR